MGFKFNMKLRVVLWAAIVFTVLCMTGCGTGKGGGASDSILTGSAKLDITQILNLAWQSYKDGNYSDALEKFNSAILAGNEDEKKEARIGYAWAYARVNGMAESVSKFEGIEEKEGLVGLGIALLSRRNFNDIRRAVSVFEQAGLSNVYYEFEPDYEIGITNAEAHAMLALAYYLTGKEKESLLQIQRAQSLEPENKIVQDIAYTLSVISQ